VCARFTLKSSSDVVGNLFDLDEVPELRPRTNIAPTQDVLGVVQHSGTRVATWFRWGLIPSWANEASIGQKMINARCETAMEKPSFRTAFKKRRCLIVADGFYEWTDPIPFVTPQTGAKPPRQPYWIGMKDHKPFAFAGLWELNQKTELGSVETCAILTGEPNELLAQYHDRMPIILPPDLWDLWLDPDFQDVEALCQLMKPYSSELMETYTVHPQLNNPRVEGFDLDRRLEAVS
jgi:putative SOS response-associated peptidase YedK